MEKRATRIWDPDRAVRSWHPRDRRSYDLTRGDPYGQLLYELTRAGRLDR